MASRLVTPAVLLLCSIRAGCFGENRLVVGKALTDADGNERTYARFNYTGFVLFDYYNYEQRMKNDDSLLSRVWGVSLRPLYVQDKA